METITDISQHRAAFYWKNTLTAVICSLGLLFLAITYDFGPLAMAGAGLICFYGIGCLIWADIKSPYRDQVIVSRYFPWHFASIIIVGLICAIAGGVLRV